MKICLVSTYDLALEGGVNKHIFYLARHLRELGDEVEIVGPASGPVAGHGDRRGLQVVTFGGIVSIQSNESDNRIGLLTSPLAVRRYLRERSFDVLHIHEPLVPSLAFYCQWMARARARLCTFHCYSESESLLRHGARKLLAPHLWSFHRGIAVSEAAARYARVAWSRPLSIIPNGVDTTFFTPAPSPRVEPRGDEPLRLLFVGQWTDKRKGLPVLLDAFAQLRARQVDVTLDVVGQGDPRIPPPAGIGGITFHGHVSESELRRRFRECDIFVAPSTGQESFGIVLVEAMSVGKAIICSDIDGYREVVSTRGALLVPPHQPAALAEAIITLAGDSSRRRELGQFNRGESARYDWARLAMQIREEYELALRTPRTRLGLGHPWTLYRTPNSPPLPPEASRAAAAEADPMPVVRAATANSKR